MKERVKTDKKDRNGDSRNRAQAVQEAAAQVVAPSAEERGLMQVAIPIETHQRAKAVAKVRGRSLGEYVDNALLPVVERDEKEIAQQYEAMRARSGSLVPGH